MPTQFQVVSVDNGGSKPVTFSGTVQSATVAVQGFDTKFNSDHHIREIQVRAGIGSINGSTVTITGVATMNDDSNNRAGGTVDVLVIAETA
ncbi:MAG TPA: hypothetical protein VMW27_00240 [Thermoanaerobaculia bacterium]|nr:hypothetical protein [Thermoanaerobaculia bacterium]